MKSNDSGSFWFHMPVILIKIVRVLTKKPSGQPKNLELQIWGRLIKIATAPELGRIRLEIITLPLLTSIKDKKSKSEEDYQPTLDLGE